MSNLVEADVGVEFDNSKDYGNRVRVHLDPRFTDVNKIIKNTFILFFSCSIIKWLNTYIVVIIMLLCSAFVILLN